MKYRFLIIAMLLYAFTVSAKPAKPGLLNLRQPDGTYVPAYLQGDEYGSVLISMDGYALTRDADGYYSYARYDSEGHKSSTFCHYGKPVASAILAESSNIPYDIIALNASRLRMQRNSEDRTSLKTKAGTSKNIKAVVILAQFPDLKFKYPDKSFENLINKAKTYFEDQYGGKASFEFVASPVVTLPNSYVYYGANAGDVNDVHAPEAIVEACRLVDDAIDFRRFDNNGDGCVDNVFMFFAGPDEAEGAGDDYIWSHSWDIESAGLRLNLDGVRIKKYALTSELIYFTDGSTAFNGIGSFCHEFGHLLGLKDLYDADDLKSGGKTEGVWGPTSLMDKGAYNDNCQTPPNFNAIEREMLGIGEGKPLYEGICRLTPINEDNLFFRMDTGTKDDYYLFEFRKASGWDKFIGGSGLLVYHVNKSNADAGYSESHQRNVPAAERWIANEVNCNPEYMCAKVLAAAKPHSPIDISSIFYPGVNAKYTTCTPYEGSFYSLSNITRTENELSFMVVGSLYMDAPDIYQDAAILNWHLGPSWKSSPEALVTVSLHGKTIYEAGIQPSGVNNYSCTVEGLQPSTEYGLEIVMPFTDGSIAKFSALFSTGKVYEGSYPAITFGKADRHISGAFKKGSGIPLRIKNAVKSSSRVWKFNGYVITVNPNTGYYELTESGTLSVEYVRDDGKRETIIKEISVK